MERFWLHNTQKEKGTGRFQKQIKSGEAEAQKFNKWFTETMKTLCWKEVDDSRACWQKHHKCCSSSKAYEKITRAAEEEEIATLSPHTPIIKTLIICWD